MSGNRCFFCAVALAALIWPAAGYAQLWKCTEAGGAVIYTNDERLTRGKRCTALTYPSAPATSRTPKAQPPVPQVQPAPPRFATSRDALRRQILTAEYEQEAAQIAKLEQQLAQASPAERSVLEAHLVRHRRNLEAIRRELSRLP